MTLDDFKRGWKGQKLAPLFADPAVIARMEDMTRSGAPAVKAIDSAVADAVGDLDDVERQHVGRWIKETLTRRGWRTKIQRSWRGGRVFTSGTVYAPMAAAGPSHPDTAPSAPQPTWQERELVSASDRYRAAIDILRAARRPGTTPATVDDFLAERRRMWGEA